VKDASAGEPKAYLKSADTTGLQSAISLAIDGDIFVLHQDGTVKKYTKGVAIADWKIHGLPTPWDSLTQAASIYADATSKYLYIFEKKDGDRPARFMEFDKTGAFRRQLLLPQEWTVEVVTFDPSTTTGVAVVQQKAYQVTFPKAN
jgi:hypothetical protein